MVNRKKQTGITLASAQFEPVKCDIAANIDIHCNMIKKAATYGADFITFPEMSITGYERQRASSMAFAPNDARLTAFQSLAVELNICIVAGAPIQINTDLFIGSFIFKPDGTSDVYTKQYLHSGEEEFFDSSFAYNPLIELKNEKISLAICADINIEAHVMEAARSYCTIYVPSIFFSLKSMEETFKMLGNYAQLNRMSILMSNFTGKIWGFEAGGQSAFWDHRGTLVGALGKNEAGLLITKKQTKSWACHKEITAVHIVNN